MSKYNGGENPNSGKSSGEKKPESLGFNEVQIEQLSKMIGAAVAEAMKDYRSKSETERDDEIAQLKAENQALRDRLDKLMRHEDIDDEEEEETAETPKRKRAKKSIGIIATGATAATGIGGLFTKFANLFNRKKDDDEEDEEIVVESWDDDEDYDDADGEKNNKEKKSGWGRKIAIGAAAIAAAAALVTGGWFVKNHVDQNNTADDNASIVTEYQNVSDAISIPVDAIQLDQLDKYLDNLDAQTGELRDAVDGGKNADQATIDQANNLLNGDAVKNYRAALESAINQRDADMKEANRLGLDIDEYQDFKAAASETGLSIDRMVEIADEFGVPADKLGTAEAMQYMRDNLKGKNNISEALECDTPQEAADLLIFTAYNNPAALAQYAVAMDEDGGIPDSGIDGLEMPVKVDQRYQQYLADRGVYENDLAEFIKAMRGANISQRAATSRGVYSYYLSANNEIICSYGPENTGGQTDTIYQVEFVNDKGEVYATMLVKNGCAQIEAGKYIPTTPTVTHTPNNPGNPNIPTDPGNPNIPTDPGEPEVEPKDPTQDVNANPENPNQKDDAPAHDNPQQMEQGQPNNDQTYVDKNGDEKPVGNTGSEEVPKVDDEDGNIGGLQEEEPPVSQW